jgi:hypothetical protein
MGWPNIHSLLINALVGTTNNALLSYLQRIVYEQIDFAFVNFINPQGIPADQARESLFEFTAKLAKKGDGRAALTGPFNALVYSLGEKYIERIFETRNYVRFELEKVQRLRMSKDEIKHLIRVSLLLRPSIYLITAQTPIRNLRAGTIAVQFGEKALKTVQQQLPLIPPDVLRSGIWSNISFLENNKVPATSRLTMIISRMARDYRPNMKVDRGASSPEKSWFNVARRNYKYFGYDVKMLDELYRIAAENGW